MILKKYIKKILLILILSIVLVVFSCLFCYLTGDEIWNYGFVYNIAKGNVPYRDFNMIVLPFYSLFMSIPLKIFGNNLFIYHIVNAIIISLIIVISCDGKTMRSVIILFVIMLANAPSVYTYNQFIMMLFILILYLQKIDYKYKNEIIGLLLGIIFTTKQNIGLILFIIYFFSSKHKIKSIIYFSIPVCLIVLYLIWNHALLSCIDYCFLGLGNFQKNFYITKFIIVLIIICLLLIYKYIKTKDINFLYLLAFQFINYPLMEYFHFIIGITPVIYYFLITMNNKYIYLSCSIFLASCIILFCSKTFIFLSKPDLFSKTSIYKYRNSLNTKKYLKQYENFYNKNQNKRIFLFFSNAYFIKIYLNKDLDKFDLINKGNMGKDENKYITDLDNICKKEKCLFVINKNAFLKKHCQLNPIIEDYVLNNYEYCGNINESDSYYCKKKAE